jgi:hypothetical protein
MWENMQEILAPLAALIFKTTKWKWTEVESKAFQKMKPIIAKEGLLAMSGIS